jgi:hypothetical protein
MIAALFLAGATVPAAPAIAAPAAAEAPVGGRGMVLARRVYPADLMVQKTVSEARRSFDEAVAANPRALAAERARPGLYAAVWRDVAPLVQAEAQAGVARRQMRLAVLYATRLTASEMDALTAFYASPTGQRAVTTMIGAIRVQPEGRAPAPSPSSAVAAERLAREATPEDEAAALRLSQGISRDKFAALVAEVHRRTIEWTAEDEARAQARLDPAIRQALQRRIAEPVRRR